MENIIDSKSAHKFTYGLFVLTTKTDKHNGCIINTAIQVTSMPYQISIAINKSNYTLKMIMESKIFNLSVLSENATFDIFKRFGFQSGKDVDKFDSYSAPVSSNGLKYIKGDYSNAFISLKVVNSLDMGTHMLIVGEVTEAKVLNDTNSCSYLYYLNNIKPKQKEQKPSSYKVYACNLCGHIYDESKEKTPFDSLPDDWSCPLCGAPKSEFSLKEEIKGEESKSKVYVCKICGYEYDESKEKVPFDSLPNDWVCPLCKHPKSDFELRV